VNLIFIKRRSILLGVSIAGLILAVGFGAFFYLSGWNDRVTGSLQIFPDPSQAFNMPAFSNAQDLFDAAGIVPRGDQLLFINGSLADPNTALPQNAIVEVRTYHSIWIELDGVSQPFQTFSPTVAEVLDEIGIHPGQDDDLNPPLDTFLTQDMVIRLRTAKPVILQIDGRSLAFTSPERTSAAILADLGFAALGADHISSEIGSDGTTVIRVDTARETISFEALYNSFATIQKYSADLPNGETDIIQAGSPGVTLTTYRDLSLSTSARQTRIGPEIVAEPVDQIVLTSNQSGVFSLETDAGDLQYWKVLEMYTTSYSPCNSGADRCLTGTSSGLPAGYGVVAVVPSVFNALNGTEVYIPGYGIGVIGDVGGGFPDGRPWIDLGFDDSNYTSWYGYHTVYFLGPPPAFDPF